MKFATNRLTASSAPHSHRRCTGVVTIEYLVLGTFLALALIVGVTTIREASSRTLCHDNLQQMAAVLLEQRQRTGQFPDQIPDHWKVRDGYIYQLERHGVGAIEVVATPGAPGRTGLEELRLVASGDGDARIEFQLAEGAIEGRRQMFTDLGKAAATCTKNLLRLAGQSGRARIEGLLRGDLSALVSRAAPVPVLVSRLDSNGDGLLTVSEIFEDASPEVRLRAGSTDPASVILREFLVEAREIMAIGQYGEDAEALPGLLVEHLLEPSNAVLSHVWTQRVQPYMGGESLTPSTTAPRARR